MKNKLLILGALLINGIMYAQEEAYISITSTEPYIELENSISVNNGEIWNEESTYLLDFDFNFVIYDQTFNSLIVSAGGGISFPNSGSKYIAVYHTPFGGYLLRDKGVGTSLSSIDYETSGDEGHKIIKVQWNNAGFVQWWSTSDTSDYVDFQIWIFQEDAHIELRYGSNQTDPGTYGDPEGDPGPFIKFHYDSCINVLSYYSAADDPLYNYYNICGPSNFTYIAGTPSEGISYAIIPTSQSCLSEGITFEHQSEIDSFQINYPYCTEIEGQVWIKGNDITNLNGLNVLSAIGDNLLIESSSLISLTGLDNLNSIGGGLEIGGNSLLVSLTGLENLTYIGGAIFGIVNNDALTNLSGLENLSYIAGDLIIEDNNALTSLSQLGNLTSIGEYLWIIGNTSLTSLAGLDNIDPFSIIDLEITYNDSLTTCEVQSICDYLANPNGVKEISNNSTGCNNLQEVEDACETVYVLENNLKFEFLIYPNPSTNTIYLNTKNSVDIIEINIYNQFGQNVMKEFRPETKIDIAILKPGIYFVELVTKEKRSIEKLILN